MKDVTFIRLKYDCERRKSPSLGPGEAAISCLIFGLSPGFYSHSKGKSGEINARWNRTHSKSCFASLNNKRLGCSQPKSQSLLRLSWSPQWAWHCFARSPAMRWYVVSKHVIESCNVTHFHQRVPVYREQVEIQHFTFLNTHG